MRLHARGEEYRLSTMKDVARAAGVSIATVSRVLTGTAAVTDSTQKKVLAAMEELQYRTASPTRSVSRKENQLTAVCMENLTSPYYVDLLRGVEDVLSINDLSPLLFNLDNDERAFPELIQTLLSFRVTGVLFIGCGDILSRVDLGQFPGLPAVVLTETAPAVPLPFPVVACDAVSSGTLAADVLLPRDRRVLYIPSATCTAPEQDPVLLSFRQTVEERGGEVVCLPAELRQLREHFGELLRGDCPKAAFVRDNETAVELLHLLHRAGLQVPEDMSVLCLQNTGLARVTDPALSVLAPTGYQVGMVGARCLTDYMERGDALEPVLSVAPKLVKRGSVQ